jgi:Tol biopolymer transport system component
LANNGRLTLIADDGIANLGKLGGLYKMIDCRRRLAAWEDAQPLCAGHPHSIAWAPDGRHIAYSTDVGPGGLPFEFRHNILLHVHDTRTGRHLSRGLIHGPPWRGGRTGLCSAEDITWSPDGSRIAYVCHRQVYVISAALDRPPRPLATGKGSWARSPSWSPDGKRLALTIAPRVRTPTLPGIYVVPTSTRTTASRVHVADGWAPTWSPDGRTIAYRSPCGAIKLATPRGIDVTPGATANPCATIGVGGVPVWSPDGRRIAIARGWPRNPCPPASVDLSNTAHVAECRFQPGIYVVNVDGSKLRHLTTETSTNGYGGGEPTWQPLPLR